MKLIPGLILATVFFILSGIHIYWGFGGDWGSVSVIPTNAQQQRMLAPTAFDSFFVATGLLCFGLFVLVKLNVLKIWLPSWFRAYGLWAIVLIFAARAVGDFNYVGFFKKPSESTFAELDTAFFSPLCLMIAVLALAVQYLQRQKK